MITVMNPAILLLMTYVLVVMVLQALGFGISRLVDYINPDLSLLVFLVLFMGAFGLAWPIAVRLTEPKSVKAALENDLKTLCHTGMIGDFTVTDRRDGSYLSVTPGPNSPPDLRRALAVTLQSLISEDRITVQG
jgi:hypothetical protein